MIMQYEFYRTGITEEEARREAIEYLTNEGKENINVVSMIPITLGDLEGLNITVLYDDEIIKTDEIKRLKARMENIKEELIELNKQRNKLDDKLSKIKDNCSHDIIVRTYNNNGTKESITSEGYCLICNQHFIDSDYYTMDFSKEFKYIIDFDCTEEIDDETKVSEAISIFYEEKEQNPNEEDNLVISHVNDKIKIKYKHS